MFASERQEKICEMLKEKGAVTTSELVRIFGVSDETIRRDLLDMERSSLIFRVHGGAISKGSMKPLHNLKTRNSEYTEEKRQLCKKALKYVAEGDIISVDTGSTAMIFAEALCNKFKKLTIVTHSVKVFEIVRELSDFEVILCGGNYLREEEAFFGELTRSTIEQLNTQKTFIFPSAVSMEFGLCEYMSELGQVQNQLIKSAEEVYVLADSSKFETKALYKVREMEKGFLYITDGKIKRELKSLYADNGIKIIY